MGASLPLLEVPDQEMEKLAAIHDPLILITVAIFISRTLQTPEWPSGIALHLPSFKAGLEKGERPQVGMIRILDKLAQRDLDRVSSILLSI